MPDPFQYHDINYLLGAIDAKLEALSEHSKRVESQFEKHNDRISTIEQGWTKIAGFAGMISFVVSMIGANVGYIAEHFHLWRSGS